MSALVHTRKRSAPYAQEAVKAETCAFSLNSQGVHKLTGPNLDVAGPLFVVADVLTTGQQDATSST